MFVVGIALVRRAKATTKINRFCFRTSPLPRFLLVPLFPWVFLIRAQQGEPALIAGASILQVLLFLLYRSVSFQRAENFFSLWFVLDRTLSFFFIHFGAAAITGAAAVTFLSTFRSATTGDYKYFDSSKKAQWEKEKSIKNQRPFIRRNEHIGLLSTPTCFICQVIMVKKI